jgi:hypothetical protein
MKTPSKSLSPTEGEGEDGIRRYDELAPVLSEFLKGNADTNVGLIFAYNGGNHKWFALLSHKAAEETKLKREFPFGVAPATLRAGLDEMYAEATRVVMRQVLFSGEAVEEDPEEEVSSPPAEDDWENW